jgi:lysophospholipase L1-like esterase
MMASIGWHLNRAWLVGVLLAAASVMAPPEPASAQGRDALSQFSWSAPSRFGHRSGGNQGIDYAQSAAQVVHGPFKIVATSHPEACNAKVTLHWTIDGDAVPAERVHGRCAVVLSFEREGTYEVTLDAELDARHQVTTHEVVVQDFLIVAIGDSVASGEGNPINRHLTHPTWDDPRCHRSSVAGTAQAADTIERADTHSSVTFVNLACSGATVPKGLTGEYRGVQAGRLPRPRRLSPQLEELNKIARDREIDAVLLSVGANDIGFGNIVAICAKPGRSCQARKVSPRHLGLTTGAKESLDQLARRALEQLPGRYAAVNARLPTPTDLPRTRVVAIEYFDPTHTDPETFCDHILGASRDELRWAYGEVIRPLNGRFRTAAREYGWQYVEGVQAAFANHGYCTGTRRWVVTLPGSLTHQGFNLKGSLHPNEEGHQQTAELIDAVLRPALLPGGKPRRPNGSVHKGVIRADSADDLDLLGGGGVAVLSMLGGAAALHRTRRRHR